MTAAMCVASSISATAKSPTIPHFAPSTSYYVVRAKLIRLGWKPARVPNVPGCGGQQNCEPFPEAVFCAGTGSAACLYAWKKGSVGIELWVEGEGTPAFAHVNRCQTYDDWNWGQKGRCR